MATNREIVAIIQARMGSSRLPGKVMLNIENEPVISHVYKRVDASKLVHKTVIATSSSKDDDVISKFCFENNISCFRGSLEDVLSRYYFASIQYPCSHVVRITADCPVIDPAIIDKLIQYHLDGGFDYSYLYGQYPDGLDCCIFNWSTLKKAHQNAKLNYEREHVGPYIENNKDLFKIGKLELFKGLGHMRWTLDEEKDFEFLKEIFKRLNHITPFFNYKDILSTIENDPMLLKINSGIIRNEGLIKSINNEIKSNSDKHEN